MEAKELKTNITKQEALVSALYKFAHDQQTKNHDCHSTAPDGTKTSVNLKSVGDAMDEIMEIFGHKVEHLD